MTTLKTIGTLIVFAVLCIIATPVHVVAQDSTDAHDESAQIPVQVIKFECKHGPAVCDALNGLKITTDNGTFKLVTTWRGIIVADENRCSFYKLSEYRYNPSVESLIVDELGGIYRPYTGQWAKSTSDVDIEHIVAKSEAHDSGMCARSADLKRAFSNDLLNLTLASPHVNRYQKRSKDAAQWLPKMNECWFADRVVQVRQKYNLTVDRAERDVLEGILVECDSTDLIYEGRDDVAFMFASYLRR